jgi:Spy/CpxP family protein refolding chaperone
MKIKLIILALVLTSSSVIQANNHDHKQGESHSHGKKIHKDLNLTEDQKISFDAIMNNQKESLKIARDEIQTNTHAELSKVLSAEQMETLENRKNKRSKMKKKMSNRKAKRKNKKEN